MKPLFTVHAGEYLVGEHIERQFRNLNVWIPSKDTGIDLLITKIDNSSSISLQVKLSKDYKKFGDADEFDRRLFAAGWLTLNHDKIAKSTADYWVFVLVSHERKMLPHYIIITPAELLDRLVHIHGKSKTYHFYPWIMSSNLALDGRKLSNADKIAIATGQFELGNRDFSTFLNNWAMLENLNKM
jgi:hypothetical protein